MKKILVAVDGSKPSFHAAAMAIELARATGAKLTAAYSVVPLMMPGEVPFTVVNQIVDAEVARAKAVLQEVRDQFPAATFSTVELQGSAAEAIAGHAEEGGYDLIVVGSRGRNAVARVLLGSVADRLVHISRKPVLVAR